MAGAFPLGWLGSQGPLLGSERADDAPTLLRRGHFDLANLRELIDHTFHHPAAFIDMHDFSSTKDDGNLHFVFRLEERSGELDFEIDIVLSRFGTQPDFFGLGVMDLALAVLLALLILEFAVVHYAADRRPLVRRHLDQIEPRFAGDTERLVGGDDAQLFSFMRDHADGRNSDLIIDPHMLAVDFKTLS